MMLTILVLSFVMMFFLNFVSKQRKIIINQGNQYVNEIITSAKNEEKKEFLNYYDQFDPSHNRKKVLDRKENLIVVNFTNHYKNLLKENKIKG